MYLLIVLLTQDDNWGIRIQDQDQRRDYEKRVFNSRYIISYWDIYLIV